MKHKDDTQLTPAEFKRKYMNKAAQQRATSAVIIRSNVGAMTGVPGIGKIKAKLREVWINRGENTGTMHKPTKAVAGRVVPKHEWIPA